MKNFTILFVVGLMISTSCRNFKSHSPQIIIKHDSVPGSVIADTIIYDVIIKNPNPEDAWTNECLKNLHHSSLIDSLFTLVYSQQAVAYDYDTQKPLKVKDIRSMEKEESFSRDNIGKIQFTEKWYFDASSQQLQKEVISIVLGHELVNDEGMVYGYKPVFRLQLNH